MIQTTVTAVPTKSRTGIEGLDTILGGGLPCNRTFLLQGIPGTGKTTTGLHFLLAGRDAGEVGLFLSLSQSEETLRQVARSHGWSLEGLNVEGISHSVNELRQQEQTLFHSGEVELGEVVSAILEQVQATEAKRVVIDSLSELRLLAGTPQRYRRELIALKMFFEHRKVTVIYLDSDIEGAQEFELQSFVDGIIRLEQMTPDYGDLRRRLHVVKMRGMPMHEGYHEYIIQTGGLKVFPRISVEERAETPRRIVQSGAESLDKMLGGGLVAGASCLLMGAAGTGKSSLTTLYAHAAAERGERVAIYIFDETETTYLDRAETLGLDMRPYLDDLITLEQADMAELQPGKFANDIRAAVEQDGVRLVVIDSLTGYISGLPGGWPVLLQLRELLTYLNGQGVLTLLTIAQHGILGTGMKSSLDMSYITDSVMLLRHYEVDGYIKQAITIIKQRHNGHEKTIRALSVGEEGIEVGEVIESLQGILTGVPAEGKGESRPAVLQGSK